MENPYLPKEFIIKYWVVFGLLLLFLVVSCVRTIYLNKKGYQIKPLDLLPKRFAIILGSLGFVLIILQYFLKHFYEIQLKYVSIVAIIMILISCGPVFKKGDKTKFW